MSPKWGDLYYPNKGECIVVAGYDKDSTTVKYINRVIPSIGLNPTYIIIDANKIENQYNGYIAIYHIHGDKSQ